MDKDELLKAIRDRAEAEALQAVANVLKMVADRCKQVLGDNDISEDDWQKGYYQGKVSLSNELMQMLSQVSKGDILNEPHDESWDAEYELKPLAITSPPDWNYYNDYLLNGGTLEYEDWQKMSDRSEWSKNDASTPPDWCYYIQYWADGGTLQYEEWKETAKNFSSYQQNISDRAI